MKTKTRTPLRRNSINCSPLRCDFLVIAFALALACFALLPTARAVTPAPDGGYPNNNTAEGDNALLNLTTGTDNTAIGFQALSSDTTAVENTAIGSQALLNNTTGSLNTATGSRALLSNTSGTVNTASGQDALELNTTGVENTATGGGALGNNKTGSFNTATGSGALSNNTAACCNTASGWAALQDNTTGSLNTATGYIALVGNSTGSNNTANGSAALLNNTTGSFNTAEGFRALGNSTGSSNTALGSNAGINLTTGSNNIIIGAGVVGAASDANTIRIGASRQTATFVAGIYGGTVGSGVGVIVGANGHLGTVQSSERFKDEIKPMDKESETILALKPVTFHYKKELDPERIPQFGLIAEQVEKVTPDLVVRDEDGKAYSVRYEAVNAMLLNEFLKEHRTVQDLKKEVAALTAMVKEQASQIKKVSAQVEVSKPAPQLVVNNR